MFLPDILQGLHDSHFFYISSVIRGHQKRRAASVILLMARWPLCNKLIMVVRELFGTMIFPGWMGLDPSQSRFSLLPLTLGRIVLGPLELMTVQACLVVRPVSVGPVPRRELRSIVPTVLFGVGNLHCAGDQFFVVGRLTPGPDFPFFLRF